MELSGSRQAQLVRMFEKILGLSITSQRLFPCQVNLFFSVLLMLNYLRCRTKTVIVGDRLDSTGLSHRHKAALIAKVESYDTHFLSIELKFSHNFSLFLFLAYETNFQRLVGVRRATVHFDDVDSLNSQGSCFLIKPKSLSLSDSIASFHLNEEIGLCRAAQF